MLAAGDLVMVDAFGDRRRPAAYNLYVVLALFHEGGPNTTSYRVRPVSRNGAHVKDKVVRLPELIPLAAYGRRIKTLNREGHWMQIEPDPSLTPTHQWDTPGYPRGSNDFTQVDRGALPFINHVDRHAKEADRP